MRGSRPCPTPISRVWRVLSDRAALYDTLAAGDRQRELDYARRGLDDAERALVFGSLDPRVLTVHGRLLYRIGDARQDREKLQAAVESLERALELKPREVGAWHILYYAKFALHDCDTVRVLDRWLWLCETGARSPTCSDVRYWDGVRVTTELMTKVVYCPNVYAYPMNYVRFGRYLLRVLTG